MLSEIFIHNMPFIVAQVSSSHTSVYRNIHNYNVSNESTARRKERIKYMCEMEQNN